MTDQYFYKIIPDLPTIIWVNPDPSWCRRQRWRPWGECSSPAQAQRILQMLRDRQPQREQDAGKVATE